MNTEGIEKLIVDIRTIIDYLHTEEKSQAALLAQVQPHYHESARNLLHYLALRTFDLRSIQEELSSLSISSLGHSEGYTLTNLQNILRLLLMLLSRPTDQLYPDFRSPLDYRSSKQQLRHNTIQLFGELSQGEGSRIMVTMPSEAADDYELIHSLLIAGMSIARINTSHDSTTEWYKMIQNIRQAEEETDKKCLIYIDLSGPKLRTEAVFSGASKQKGYIRLFVGDELQLVKKEPEQPFEGMQALVTLPEIFSDSKVGHRIYFDDGKIGGTISDVQPDMVIIKISQAAAEGSKLRAEKGINLPDTKLSLPSLTQNDLANLPFIAAHADIVGYSFVRQPEDVERLQMELKKLNREQIGIILKIETKDAFQNLPMLLLTAMCSPKIGVMIARGDLAVEIGFERIAEVQEEILWICEAAHAPGIWATQVLEKLAKKGTASRAEITDAAMAARAECVMLNKGPYIVNAVAALDDIIRRMQKHQFKKKGTLRPLSVAKHFWQQHKASI
ncbi:MAG: pyruvate kinase [Saprospiraceae bacterium]|nr:pyruvate kinase [Saprospiraceae bacterium]